MYFKQSQIFKHLLYLYIKKKLQISVAVPVSYYVWKNYIEDIGLDDLIINIFTVTYILHYIFRFM